MAARRSDEDEYNERGRALILRAAARAAEPVPWQWTDRTRHNALLAGTQPSLNPAVFFPSADVVQAMMEESALNNDFSVQPTDLDAWLGALVSAVLHVHAQVYTNSLLAGLPDASGGGGHVIPRRSPFTTTSNVQDTFAAFISDMGSAAISMLSARSVRALMVREQWPPQAPSNGVLFPAVVALLQRRRDINPNVLLADGQPAWFTNKYWPDTLRCRGLVQVHAGAALQARGLPASQQALATALFDAVRARPDVMPTGKPTGLALAKQLIAAGTRFDAATASAPPLSGLVTAFLANGHKPLRFLQVVLAAGVCPLLGSMPDIERSVSEALPPVLAGRLLAAVGFCQADQAAELQAIHAIQRLPSDEEKATTRTLPPSRTRRIDRIAPYSLQRRGSGATAARQGLTRVDSVRTMDEGFSAMPYQWQVPERARVRGRQRAAATTRAAPASRPFDLDLAEAMSHLGLLTDEV